jgi:hypothetical protein
MAWTVYSVPTSKKTALDAALGDDLVSRQSHTVRAAAALGGPADQLYVLVEGSTDGVRRADELVGPVGQKVAGADGEALYQKFKDEQESASAGMGLFFTEDA